MAPAKPAAVVLAIVQGAVMATATETTNQHLFKMSNNQLAAMTVLKNSSSLGNGAIT